MKERKLNFSALQFNDKNTKKLFYLITGDFLDIQKKKAKKMLESHWDEFKKNLKHLNVFARKV